MTKKISVIGSGAVGATLAYNLLCRLRLEELVLIDISEGIAKGMALDLEDTRAFLGFTTKIEASSDLTYIKNSDIVVITAGIPRKDGMTRLDLLKINGKVAKDLSLKIKELAPQAIVVVVTNPLDFITYIVTKETGFPRNRVIGMGASLDTARLKNLLFNQTKINAQAWQGYVLGQHSETMLVSLDRIKADNQVITKHMSQDIAQNIAKRVKMRGAEIVSHLKSRSAYFAPALSAASLIEAIAKDANLEIPVAVVLDGEYGIKDACFALPCVINKNGISQINQLVLTDEEKAEFKKIEELFKANSDLLKEI